MTITPQEYAQRMIEKYQRYIENLQYHRDHNSKKVEEMRRLDERIRDFQQVIDDFKVLAR